MISLDFDEFSFAQAKNLRPRYGTCGDKDMKYFSREAYSHSRCRRQCQVKDHVKECDCHLPYMIGNTLLHDQVIPHFV